MLLKAADAHLMVGKWEEAERVVALCGSDVLCIPGAERPMESRDEFVPSAGLEFLVEEACLAPLTIIATGAATDAASLVLASPVSMENVRVVWLGGFGDEVNYGSWANRMGELNGRSDIQAWRVLFEGPVDLLHVPTWPAPAKNAVATTVAAIARGAPLTRWIPTCAGMTGAEGFRVPASRTPSRANRLGITPKT